MWVPSFAMEWPTLALLACKTCKSLQKMQNLAKDAMCDMPVFREYLQQRLAEYNPDGIAMSG